MPGLDLCARRLCRQGRALLSEKRHQAAAAEGGIYLRRRALGAKHPKVVIFRSMHGGEEPCEAKAGQPCPYRLAAHAEIPGAHHRVRAADQIVDRQQPDAAFANRDAAVGGIVAIIAEYEEFSRRHGHFHRVVEPAVVAQLVDRMRNAVRQRLDIAPGALYIAVIVLRITRAVGFERRRVIVDEELALAHLDTVAGHAYDTLDPGLRGVA